MTAMNKMDEAAARPLPRSTHEEADDEDDDGKKNADEDKKAEDPHCLDGIEAATQGDRSRRARRRPTSTSASPTSACVARHGVTTIELEADGKKTSGPGRPRDRRRVDAQTARGSFDGEFIAGVSSILRRDGGQFGLASEVVCIDGY